MFLRPHVLYLGSFGVLCFEVATRAIPFPDMNANQLMAAVAFRKERPQIPEWSSPSPDVVRLMKHCWTQDPDGRPNGFQPIAETLSQYVKRDGDPREPHSPAGESTSLLAPNIDISGGMPIVGRNIGASSISGSKDASSGNPSFESQSPGAVDGLVPDMGGVLMPLMSCNSVFVPEGDGPACGFEIALKA